MTDSKTAIPAEALTRLNDAIANASEAGERDTKLLSLATCGKDGVPSVRNVLAADINEDGILFFINSRSGKGLQLAENPHVGLCFYWSSLGLQLVIDGVANQVSDVEADAIWQKRDRSKQITAWASNQSEETRGRKSLQERSEKIRQSYDFEPIPMPEHWKAYRVAPTRLEFWQSGWRRVHERKAYLLENGKWVSKLYEP